jgi:NifU-like protein involved in Fe-S cluster formation
LTELISGRTVEEIREITNERLSGLMGGLPPEKVHCSVLAEQAIREALESWKRG